MDTVYNVIVCTAQFDKLFKKKKRSETPQMIEKIRSEILRLRTSEDPKKLGEYKKGNLDDYLALKINRSTRLLYQVGERNCSGIVTVTLCRICSHKSVYGKD